MFRLTFSVILIVSCLVFSPTSPASANPSGQPEQCNVGVYLLSLQDFDVSDRSFGADFWIWTNCQSQFPEALQLVDFANSKAIKTSLYSEETKENIHWATQKVHGVFRHDWNIANFPFDHHKLTIEIEHGLLDQTNLVYVPDQSASSYQEDSTPAGWNITDFQLTGQTQEYKTTYGDPTLDPDDGSQFSRIALSVALQRSSFVGFWKLTNAVYISAGIALGIYLINPATGFGTRLGTLVGALFAIVVNQRVIDGTLGETEGLTLVHQIHITALLYVLTAVILTIWAFRGCEAGNEKIVLWRDRFCFYVSVISFFVVNAVLIGHAAFAG